MRKRLVLIKTITAIFMLLLSVFLIVIIYLNSSKGNRFIKEIIADQFESNVDANIEIGDLETNLTSTLVLNKISLYTSKGSDADLLISIESIRTKYNIFTIIFDELGLDSLDIIGLNVHLKRDSNGVFNLPSLKIKTEEDTNSTLPFYIGHASFRNSNIYYNDESIPIDGSFKNINTILERNKNKKSYSLVFNSDNANISYADKPIKVKKFSINGDVNENFQYVDLFFQTDVAGICLKGNLIKDRDSLLGEINIDGNLKNLTKNFSDPEVIVKHLGHNVNAQLKFSVANLLIEPVLSWTLSIPQYQIGNLSLEDFNFTGKYHSDTLKVSNLSLGLDLGNISVSGWILNNDLLSNNLELTVRNINLSKLLYEFSELKSPIADPVFFNMKMNTKGSLNQISKIKLNSFVSIASDSVIILDSKISFNNNLLTISSNESVVDIRSTVNFMYSKYNGTMDIIIPSLKPILRLFNFGNIDGGLKLTSNIFGESSEIKTESTVTSGGVYLKDIPILDTIFAALIINKNELLINKGFLSGNINDIIILKSLISIENISGGVNYQLTASGPLTNPDLVLALKLDNPSIGDYRFQESSLDLKLHNKVMSILEFNFPTDSLIIYANGELDFVKEEGSFEIIFDVPNSEEDDIIKSEVYFPKMENLNLSVDALDFRLSTLNKLLNDPRLSEGLLSWNLNYEFKDNKIKVDLPFSAEELLINNIAIDKISGNLKLLNDTVIADSIQVLIGKNKSLFNSSLTLGKDKNDSYEIDMNKKFNGIFIWDSLNLSIFDGLLDNSVYIEGVTDINLQWDGTLWDPNLVGKVSLDKGGLIFSNKKYLLSDFTGRIEFKDSIIQSRELSGFYDQIPISINTELNIIDQSSLFTNIDLKSNDIEIFKMDGMIAQDSLDISFIINNFNLSLSNPILMSRNQIGGFINSEIKLGGNFSNPIVIGWLNLTDLSFNPNVMNLKIMGGNIFTSLSNNKIIIDSSYLPVGKGSIILGGSVQYDKSEIKGINFSLSSKDIRIFEKELFSTKINKAEIKFSSFETDYKMSGNIELGETKIIRDFEMSDIFQILASKTKGVLERADRKVREKPLDLIEMIEYNKMVELYVPEYLKNLKYDINIKNSDSVFVDNNILKLRLSPDLGLRGSIISPLLLGRIKSEDEGKLYFLDREFRVTRTIIDFADAARMNPILDISAESEVTETADFEDIPEKYSINMDIIGPLDEFQFNLTSQPALESSDIISLLSLGITYEKLQTSTDMNSILTERSQVLATRSLSSQLDKFYNKWLGDYLAIDHIGISGNIFETDKTRIEVSKSWGNRVEVSYSTSVNDINKQILMAKFKLNNYFFLQGITDQQDESGADLKFRIKFK